MAWYTAADSEVVERWADAPSDEAWIADLLAVARIQCEAYAPALAEGAAVPANYSMGQLMQARAIWAAMKKNSNGDLDAGGYAIPAAHPLDWAVTQMLRPRRAVPFV